MRKIILFILLNIYFINLWSQNFTIIGNIKDNSNNEPCAFVNIVITPSNNKTKQIQGTQTNNKGEFVIKNLKRSDLSIVISSIGYKKYEQRLELNNILRDTLFLNNIMMIPSNETLEEVVINEKINPIEIEADKLTMSINDNVASTAMNVFDLLKKTPSVNIDNDDNISINGKSGILIQFEGRDMKLPWNSLVQILKGMPTQMVDKIEVVSNPSAKYDAEGIGGIINIRFKKGGAKGFNGSVGLNGFYTNDFSYMGNVNLNYVDDKWTTNLAISAMSFNQSVESITQIRTNDSLNNYSIDNSFNSLWTNQNKNISLGADYNIDKQNTVGLHLSFFDNRQPPLKYPMRSSINNDSIEIISDISNQNQSQNYSINTNFIHKFDTIGQKLSFDLDFITNNNNTFNSTSFADVLVNKNNTATNFNTYILKADYVKPFENQLSIETGIKLSYTSVDNKLSVFDTTNNIFEYKDNINAFYLSGSKTFNDKLSARLGLRFENTNTFGKLPLEDTSNSVSYYDIFPNLSFSYVFSELSRWNLAYNMRISRPSYTNLNPFLSQQNPTTFSKGNPELLPQYSHNISLTNTFMYALFTTLDYSYTKDIVNQMPTLVEGFGVITMPENIQSSHRLSLSVSGMLPLRKWWRLMFYLNGSYTKYTSKIDNDNLKIDNKNFMAYGSSNFTLPLDIKLDISGYYTSGMLMGLYSSDGFGGMNVNVSKTFFKDMLTLTAGVNNLLAPQRIETSFALGQTEYKNIYQGNLKMIMIGIRFNFGNFSSNPFEGQKKRSNEEDRVSGKSSNPMGGGGMIMPQGN